MSWEHEDGKRKSGGSSVGSSYGYSAGPDQKRSRTERSQQSQTVAAVSQQLEAYARRARTASYNSTNGGGSRSASPVVMEMEVRGNEERSDELPTLGLGTRSTGAPTFAQDAPPLLLPQSSSSLIPTLFAIRFAHCREGRTRRTRRREATGTP